MDESKTFLCTVMHHRLFPGPLLGLGKQFRVQLLVEVGTEELLLRSPAASTKHKIMGTESLAEIVRVVIERVSGGAQRIAILRHSLLWMALCGFGTMAYLRFTRSYPFDISVSGALMIATFNGLLAFLVSGGFGRKQEVVRFHFTPSVYRTFYLEIPPAQEPELHQALLAAGLNPEGPRTNH